MYQLASPERISWHRRWVTLLSPVTCHLRKCTFGAVKRLDFSNCINYYWRFSEGSINLYFFYLDVWFMQCSKCQHNSYISVVFNWVCMFCQPQQRRQYHDPHAMIIISPIRKTVWLNLWSLLSSCLLWSVLSFWGDFKRAYHG